jgi:hypothetical protein
VVPGYRFSVSLGVQRTLGSGLGQRAQSMGFQDSAHRGFRDLDLMATVQVIHDPKESQLMLGPERQDLFHHFRRCSARMAVGNRLFPIESQLSFFLVFLFPKINA